MPICKPINRVCYKSILIKNEICLDFLKPCHGFYADIEITQNNEGSDLTKETKAVWGMISEYEKYKGELVGYGGKHINQINPSPSLKGTLFNYFFIFPFLLSVSDYLRHKIRMK